MPTVLSEDEFFTGEKSADYSRGQSSPRAISTDEFLGVDPLSKEALQPSLARELFTTDPLAAMSRGLKQGVGMAAQVADMALGLPGQAIRVGANIGGRVKALASGGSAADADWAGKAMADQVPRSLTNPVGAAMEALGYGKDYNENQVAHVMENVMGVVSKGGEWVEEKTGKVLTKRAVEDIFETFMLSAGGRGTAAVLDPKLKAVGAPRVENGPFKGLTPEQAAKAARKPPSMLYKDLSELVKRSPKAPRVEPTFGDGPIGAGVDLPEVQSTPDGRPSPFVFAGKGGPDVWTTREKLPVGEALDLTDEPKLPVGEATEVPNIPTGEALEIPDIPTPQVKTIGGAVGEKMVAKMRQGVVPAAVAGTGLGLAILYPDQKEEALGAAVGALAVGRGKGLTLDAIHALPEATPVKVFRDQSATTLLTLERLPENGYRFRKQTIQDQLKRQDVTKAERELIEGVMKEVEGDTVTAKELWTGVKLRTGDWELTRKETSQWADYGLDEIQRAPADYFDEIDLESLHAVRGANPNQFDIDSGPGGDFLFSVEARTRAEALELARRQIEDADRVTASATTTIYDLPEGVLAGEGQAANHFSDPNYFAHTRSFVEGGVRHVVEIQSDLAQKAGKVLGEEERARLGEEIKTFETIRDLLSAVREGYRNLSIAEFKKEVLSLPDPLPKVLEEHARTLSGADKALSAQDAIWIRRALEKMESESVLGISERKAKLSASGSTERIQPLIKDWYKRVVREELARGARDRQETQQLIALKEATIASRLREQEAANRPSEWAAKNPSKLDHAAYDLDILSMDLRNGHVSEGTARQYMLRTEAEMPLEVQRRWKEYYEANADETEGFLRPGPAESGSWGSAYASNFPKTLANFLRKESGKSDTSWAAEDIKGYKEDIARLEKANKTVRFATADTVAKVEGWPEQVGEAARRIQNRIDSLEHDLRLATSPNQRLRAPSRAGETTEQAITRWEEELERQKVLLAEVEANAAAFKGPRFYPEHQSIYDRYRGDVEKFLRGLGGKPYTDSAGHTWIEVPVEGSKDRPAGPRVQMLGGVDPKLATAVAAIGGGAALVAYLSPRENRKKNAALAAAILGLAAFARERSPFVREWVESAGRGAENVLSVISEDIRNASPALLKRMRDHERWVMEKTHERLNTIVPFVAELRKLPEAAGARLNAALLTGDAQAIRDAIIASGSRALQTEYSKVREILNDMGRELHATGRLRKLVMKASQEYYPRIVTDLEGLLNSFGKEERSVLQKMLDQAERVSNNKTGLPLTPVERSFVVGEFLKQRSSGQGRSGFLKPRSIEEVTPELARFYAPASESLPIYIRAMTKEIERAKFFGEDLVRDPETGVSNLELSIQRVVERERTRGVLDDKQIEKLRGLLASRFGPGEAAADGYIQTFRNLTNVGLLGNITSAGVQLGDLALPLAAYGLLPTARAVATTITRRPLRATVRDIGLVDHISEEVTGGVRTPLIVLGREVSSAKFVEKVFKFTGFSLVDQFGKAVSINASWDRAKRAAATPVGVAKLKARYGEAWGSDFDALVKDLRSGEMTENVKSLLFYDLSDLQPISKLEVPKAYLDHPNGRVLYQMKTYMVKQMNVLRREALGEMRKGNVRQGMTNLLRYGLALGISGATTSFIVNWMLGKDAKLEWGDIPENALKTMGWSSYVVDKARKGEPLSAIAGTVAPPWKMWDRIVTMDPSAVQYMPPLGKLYYYNAMGGAQKADAFAEKQRRLAEMPDDEYELMLEKRRLKAERAKERAQ